MTRGIGLEVLMGVAHARNVRTPHARARKSRVGPALARARGDMVFFFAILTMVDKRFITVSECKDCASVPSVQIVSFLTTKLLPLYYAAGGITAPALIAAVAVDVVIKIIENLIKGAITNDCLNKAAARHLVVDRRMTVGKDPRTGRRVRKRTGGPLVDPNLIDLLPGGGEFGGSGAGSTWDVVDPITGLSVPQTDGPLQIDRSESNDRIIVNGKKSRILVSNGWTTATPDRSALVQVTRAAHPGEVFVKFVGLNVGGGYQDYLSIA